MNMGMKALILKTLVWALLVGAQADRAYSAGQTASWGDNGSGQLGYGVPSNFTNPQSVLTLGILTDKKVVQVSAGDVHTCALTSDGVVACWGFSGRLGVSNPSDSPVPIAIDTSGVLLGKTVTQISSGREHTCAVTSDGSAVCWGSDFYRQLGNGDLGDSWVPTLGVPGMPCCEAVEIRCGPDRGNRDSKPTASS
jgi:alpha-tubulin suppressor-like RCC1 family protein